MTSTIFSFYFLERRRGPIFVGATYDYNIIQIYTTKNK